MPKILVVDDGESKVQKLQELIREIDPSGENYRIVLPITPRSELVAGYDDRKTIIDFLDTHGLEDISAIFQDHNLSGIRGHDLVPIYRERGYQGPIISFTGSDWEWYKKFEKDDLSFGFTATFPWGDKFREEQLEFLRKNLP